MTAYMCCLDHLGPPSSDYCRGCVASAFKSSRARCSCATFQSHSIVLAL